MSARTTTKRRLLAALSAPLVMAGLVVAPASTAQAHDNVWVDDNWRDTDKCGCYVPDEHDGTYFEYDEDGYAYKGEIYSGQDMVGKVEFHPHGEKLWIYDTEANGDGLYVGISWYEDGQHKTSYTMPHSGSIVRDYDFDDGSVVTIHVWDDGYVSEDSEILVENAVA